MFREVNLATVGHDLHNALGDGIIYRACSEVELMLDEKFADSSLPYRLIFPKVLPMDGDGDLFIPGTMSELTRSDHPIYELLDADHTMSNIWLMTGTYLGANGHELFRFRLSAPSEARHVIICMDWGGQKPMDYPKVAPAGLEVEYMYRYVHKDGYLGSDLWIVKKPDCLADELAEMQQDIDAAIGDGDVYAESAPLVAPIYLNFMRTMLEPINVDGVECTLERLSPTEAMLYYDSPDMECPEAVMTLPCSLTGAQRLLRYLNTIRQ